jgi:hypothetical protein
LLLRRTELNVCKNLGQGVENASGCWWISLDPGCPLRRQTIINGEPCLTYNSNMDETLPDRLSVDPQSPYYNQALIERGVGIRFNGIDKTNIEEYCVSEGWVRISAGKSFDRHGRRLTMKLNGKVEPYFRDTAEPENSTS